MMSYKIINTTYFLMASIQALVGVAKDATDLTSIQKMVRYNESSVIQSSKVFRFTFPKQDQSSLDCRSIRLQFRLNLINPGIEKCGLDSGSGNCSATLFDGVRALSGSNVLFDLDQASTSFNFEDLTNLHMDTARFEWMLDGRMNNDRDVSGKTYICTIGPKDGTLNSSSLLLR